MYILTTYSVGNILSAVESSTLKVSSLSSNDLQSSEGYNIRTHIYIKDNVE